MNSSQRILVVDDDHHLREIISSTLIQNGYEVDTARDGAEAWKTLNEASYYLLITDYKMPRVNGLELIKKLRSEAKLLPVILISGTMPTEELNRQPDLRIDAMLEKPFTIAGLLGAVKKVMGVLIDPTFASLMLPPEQLEPETSATRIPPVEKSSRNPDAQTYSSPRILLVDDDRDVRQLNVDMLTASGYDVEDVPDGAAGWQALQANHYDLVITDNQMPRMTGLEMIEKLRAARIGTPVIMATGNVPAHEFVRKPWLKPEATLQRPFTLNDLLETVKHVLPAGPGPGAHKNTLPTNIPA